jgi:hypothetical protein
MTIRNVGIFILLFFTTLAWILSMTANMDGAELGAMFNLVLPPLAGSISVFIFLVVCWLTKDKTRRIIAITVLCLYLIYMGLVFQFNPDYLPFPF